MQNLIIALIIILQTLSPVKEAGSINLPQIGDSYGGNQAWFVSQPKQEKGCAPVAGTNILAYFIGGYSDKESYIRLMNKVHDKMIPQNSAMRFTGVSSASYFSTSMVKIASEYGLTLDYYHASNYNGNVGTFAKFIENGIDNSVPVVLFIGKSKTMFSEHVVTVTGYKNEPNQITFTVSSWGNKYEIKLTDILMDKLDAVYFIKE